MSSPGVFSQGATNRSVYTARPQGSLRADNKRKLTTAVPHLLSSEGLKQNSAVAFDSRLGEDWTGMFYGMLSLAIPS